MRPAAAVERHLHQGLIQRRQEVAKPVDATPIAQGPGEHLEHSRGRLQVGGTQGEIDQWLLDGGSGSGVGLLAPVHAGEDPSPQGLQALRGAHPAAPAAGVG